MGIVNRIKWQFKRYSLMKLYDGFYASPLSYCDNQCLFSDNVRVYKTTILCNVSVGKHTYFANSNSKNTDIGSFCSIASGAYIGGLGSHPTNFISTHPIFYSVLNQSGKSFSLENHYDDEFKRTSIGNDVWIGLNAIILDGITIGNGAIIAAGAIVTKDIPPYAIVAGVPAKIIRFRYSESEISLLNSSKWWELPDSNLQTLQQKFIENDVNYIHEYSLKYNEKNNTNH